MPRARSTQAEETNGRNGAGLLEEQSPATLLWEPGEIRKIIATLAISGSLSDAQMLYLALPGSTSEGWHLLERQALGLRAYVVNGDPPYVRPVTVQATEYQGIPTPEGDCAEDALPREARNQNREAEKRKMNGEHQA
jgi:hypothetical protein